jgi:hypothetical protein
VTSTEVEDRRSPREVVEPLLSAVRLDRAGLVTQQQRATAS